MTLLLTGIDGANPLGFLAALGVQRALADQGLSPSLRWVYHGAWRPELDRPGDVERVLDLLEADLETWREEPALGFHYVARDKKTGEPKRNKKTGELILERDLKPLPEEYARFLREMAQRGGRSEVLALAFATDVGMDNSGFVKPTALHFTAGQQRFLEMVRQLRDGITRDHLREALLGPWRREDELPVLGWDAACERMYALRAFDPSDDKKTGTAGADWLAFLGLRCYPTVPDGPKSNMTTAVSGSWKKGRFIWVIWSPPLGPAAVRLLIQQAEAARAMTPVQLRAWGIEQVYESAIYRHEQGGYGSMSPARIIR